MSAVLLFGIFFALLFLNVPIAMSLGVSSIITTMAVKPAMMSTIAANLYSSPIPMFCWRSRSSFLPATSWTSAAYPCVL